MAANEDMNGSIDALIKTMETGFDSVRAEIEKLRQEFKHEIVEMKHEIQSVKQSITFTQDEVDTLKEKAETNIKEMKGGLEELNKKVVALEVQLNAEIEKKHQARTVHLPRKLTFQQYKRGGRWGLQVLDLQCYPERYGHRHIWDKISRCSQSRQENGKQK